MESNTNKSYLRSYGRITLLSCLFFLILVALSAVGWTIIILVSGVRADEFPGYVLKLVGGIIILLPSLTLGYLSRTKKELLGVVINVLLIASLLSFFYTAANKFQGLSSFSVYALLFTGFCFGYFLRAKKLITSNK